MKDLLRLMLINGKRSMMDYICLQETQVIMADLPADCGGLQVLNDDEVSGCGLQAIVRDA